MSSNIYKKRDLTAAQTSKKNKYFGHKIPLFLLTSDAYGGIIFLIEF